MLQTYFGDEEHTAADGPYVRVMKTRKWLLIVTAFATLYNMHLIKPDKLGEILKVITIPSQSLAWFLLSSIIYLSAIYIALIVQLGSVYDIVLADRLKFRKDKELESAQSKVDESRMEVIRLDNAKDASRSMVAGLQNASSGYSQSAHDAANAVYNRNVDHLAKIIESDPADRKLYKPIEKMIDVVRIIGPAFVVLPAILFLVARI